MRIINHIKCLFALSLMLFSISSAADFTESTIAIIPWGDEASQLKIGGPVYEDVNETPDDSSDDFIGNAGPSHGIIDKNENIYISSYSYMQLKGFNNNGGLIFNYSKGEPGYNREFYYGWLRKIYVDSLNNIYIVGGASQDYIAVVDTNGHLINKLTPYGLGSGVVVSNIYFNSDDALTFYFRNDTYYLYENGSFAAGGSMDWRAKDRNYYDANLEDSSSIRFIKSQDPDINGEPASLVDNRVTISGEPSTYMEFLGVDDNMYIYIFIIGENDTYRRVLIYDLSYNLMNEISFPPLTNKYMWYMTPYMRPSDGNIYEFRCLDDGLHVIRWSKQ
jgi:hypothetical protein